MKVEAGALYVPEDSEEDAHFFSYSVTFSLQSEAEQRAAWPAGAGPCHVVQRVQLRTRHWVITDAKGAVSSPQGPLRSCRRTDVAPECDCEWTAPCPFFVSAGRVDEVRGEAVVGHFPILTAGGPPFTYRRRVPSRPPAAAYILPPAPFLHVHVLTHRTTRSCTNMAEVPGQMSGDFAFVEGTLQSPAGPEFLAVCAPFALAVPELVY